MPATVGVGRWAFRVPACRSLKQKRSVVRSLRDSLRARYPVSVSETDFQDDVQRAELTAALAASDRTLAESLLGKLDDQVCSDPRIFIIERDVTVWQASDFPA